MAVQFESSPDVVRLTQTRSVFRIVTAGVAVVGGLGIVLVAFLGQRHIPTTIGCVHASDTCRVRAEGPPFETTIASIASVELETRGRGTVVALRRAEPPRYHAFCGARDDAGAEASRAIVAELSAFLADPRRAAIELHCDGRPVDGGLPLQALPFAALGWLLMFLVFGAFSDEIEAVLDRKDDRIEVKGRSWIRRAWRVSRPLRDVERIEVRSRYVGRGQSALMIYAVFRDGTSALLWSPAATTPSTVEHRLAAMRALLTP